MCVFQMMVMFHALSCPHENLIPISMVTKRSVDVLLFFAASHTVVAGLLALERKQKRWIYSELVDPNI